MTSERFDSYFLDLSIALSKGKIDVQALKNQLLNDKDLLREADGENIKTLIRLSFMMSHMGKNGFQEAYYHALLAYHIAKTLAISDINFALDIGVGNGVACSLFALTTILYRLGQYLPRIEYLEEILSILEENDDLKGYLETLLELSENAALLNDVPTAIMYLKRSLQKIDESKDISLILQENSNQDMVRIDNKNVFNFGQPPIINLGSLPLIRTVIKIQIASMLIQSKSDEDITQFSEEPYSLWHENALPDDINHKFILNIINTHCTATAVRGDIPKAAAIAKEYLETSKKYEDSQHTIGAALILSFCYQELGNKVLQYQYRELANQLMDKEKSSNGANHEQ